MLKIKKYNIELIPDCSPLSFEKTSFIRELTPEVRMRTRNSRGILSLLSFWSWIRRKLAILRISTNLLPRAFISKEATRCQPTEQK